MADEKPKDDKPKGDAKPKVEEKPTEHTDPGIEITKLLLFLFLIMTFLGGALTAVTSFFSGGPEGISKKFSVEYLLESYTSPFLAVLNPIGETAIALHDKTAVFDEPGGNIIGTQKQRATGTVMRGSVEIGGVRYWYIDFEKDPDGWVAERDMAIVTGVPSPFTRLLLFIHQIVSWFRIILWVLIPIMVGIIVYVLYGLAQVRKNTRGKLYEISDEEEDAPATSINKSWDRVKLFVESHNESEWRLAVIEADIMLAELLDTMNLTGDTIGEKLKGVEKSDFTTLDLAWEAHKIRNQIAHDPSFMLNQREAKRVIDLFEEVFREFAFI